MIIDQEILKLAELDYLKNGVPGCAKEVHIRAYLSGYCLAIDKLTKPELTEPSIYDQMI